jgi:hypothetical protein
MEKIIHKTTTKQQTSDFHYWQSQPILKRFLLNKKHGDLSNAKLANYQRTSI